MNMIYMVFDKFIMNMIYIWLFLKIMIGFRNDEVKKKLQTICLI